MEQPNEDSKLDHLLEALAKSPFRRRFKILPLERSYLAEKGLPTVLVHARDFIEKRLAPAIPANDGKQTPFRGHPVFIAQHATATCCRSCLAKWHRIPKAGALTGRQQSYILEVITRWLISQPA
jgi:Domain of unknown function (DUF4186)